MVRPGTVGERGPLRYVALGDSYTIGTSVAPSERWPDQLVARLATRAPDGVAPLELVANLGVDGFTSADVIGNALPQLATLGPGFASLLIGVNDVVQGVTPSTYRRNAEVILADLLARLPPRRIVAVGTPDYTVTPAGADYGDPDRNRAAIQRNNAMLAELAAAHGIAFVDVWAASRLAATDRSLVAADGLHPSGRQYATWVDAIAPAVATLVGQPPALRDLPGDREGAAM